MVNKIQHSVAYSPDGTMLASASRDRTVIVWDPSDARTLFTLRGHPDKVNCVTFSPDGNLIATASGTLIKIWDATNNGKELMTIRGHPDEVTQIAFSPDSQRLASSSQDGAIRIWNAKISQEWSDLVQLNNDPAFVDFLPIDDGQRLVIASLVPPFFNQLRLHVWDAETGTESFVMGWQQAQRRTNQIRTRLARSVDGQRLALMAGQIDLLNGAAPDTSLELKIGDDPPTDSAFSSEGNRIGVAVDNEILLFDTNLENRISTISIPVSEIKESRNLILSVAFSPDDQQLAAATKDGRIFLGDPITGKAIRILQADADGSRVTCLAYRPDGLQVAAGVGNLIKVWDPTTGEPICRLMGHSEEVGGIVYSPNGSRLASIGQDRTIRLWDTTTEQELLKLGECERRRVAFSTDGHRLFALSRSTIRAWDARPFVPAAATSAH